MHFAFGLRGSIEPYEASLEPVRKISLVKRNKITLLFELLVFASYIKQCHPSLMYLNLIHVLNSSEFTIYHKPLIVILFGSFLLLSFLDKKNYNVNRYRKLLPQQYSCAAMEELNS